MSATAQSAYPPKDYDLVFSPPDFDAVLQVPAADALPLYPSGDSLSLSHAFLNDYSGLDMSLGPSFGGLLPTDTELEALFNDVVDPYTDPFSLMPGGLTDAFPDRVEGSALWGDSPTALPPHGFDLGARYRQDVSSPLSSSDDRTSYLSSTPSPSWGWPADSPTETPSNALYDGSSSAGSSPAPILNASTVAPQHSKGRGTPTSNKNASRPRRPRSSSSSPVSSRLTSLTLGRVRTTSPRNKQVGPASSKPEVHNGRLTCPHCASSFRRKADYERHVNTHFALGRDDQLVCCGVPEEDYPGYEGGSYEYGGRRMVGGCLKAFSRRDSLIRHLNNGHCLRPAHM
ncbi:hypothetical protein DAEQUDRAFT_723815 [Daedalea quercina L-15889]|uniref:C2H2-type domain-containing protein n=1 Tax=Daedalea quercina L-15889 TaxID=1314783 RepID=A0A165SAA7_9APHY|nr:hypothetical protein DAEQUDRAFT_723815 [Daedalea quercina L-15889]